MAEDSADTVRTESSGPGRILGKVFDRLKVEPQALEKQAAASSTTWTMPPPLPPDASFLEALDANIFGVGPVGFEAWEDRILVVEDPFKSGYECQSCSTTGLVSCDGCNGTGHSALVTEARCSKCSGSKTMPCPECNGKGVLLVIPEQSERRPTTGRIMSVGPKVHELRRGEAVLYAYYVGHVMDLSSEDAQGQKYNCCLRVLRESEILAKVYGGYLELRRLRRRVNMNDHGQ